ncbi:hypothetical protein HRJ35_20130 [Shewanella oneidensis MR-1]|uniref:hypothetical protein n=1 Tax=Shewanella oneidensis TaxID=70863 RepID=UPI00000E2335|nr:hypothetical protein [Shewanella oneidensis]MDX5998889.1 hypothetical protein [Shewanella oneidensis]QKG98076.1 hypothetical protein HRJ35_20130 [Shewanella oneidensis MR-1]
MNVSKYWDYAVIGSSGLGSSTHTCIGSGAAMQELAQMAQSHAPVLKLGMANDITTGKL